MNTSRMRGWVDRHVWAARGTLQADGPELEDAKHSERRPAEWQTEQMEVLRARIGDAHFGARLREQVDQMVQLAGKGEGGFHFENVTWLARLVTTALRVSHTQERGRLNALALGVHEREMWIADLPHAFDGLSVLHLSDLHLDAVSGFGALVARALSRSAFDLCVITGDFRFLDSGRYEHLEQEIEVLAPALQCKHGVYGVLGNHDFLEMVPMLERHGIRILLNESASISERDAVLWLVGLDDPHLYGLHDFERALRDVDEDGARLLLVHTPEVARTAAEHGFCACFAGHTHGGQFCLPGGMIIYSHARGARQYAAGEWTCGAMPGYTSRGVGSSGVFARFNCPPELVIHHLRRR